MRNYYLKMYQKYTKNNGRETFNKDTKKIAEKLELVDWIEQPLEWQSYITLKDHKEDFPYKILCRFVKSSKSDIAKISKISNDKIN